jgi:hypothetical protein
VKETVDRPTEPHVRSTQLKAAPGADAVSAVADAYRRFGKVEARGKSSLYEALCEGVASDPDLLDLLVRQPPAKRQPNLLLAAVRFLFGTQPNYAAFRACVLGHQSDVEQILRSRRTQTNEPGRCAALLPALAMLPGPLALLEVGAAAGLCLLPDRYGYDYDGRRVGSGEVIFPCTTYGPVPIPPRLPEIVWRAGIDLEPLDLEDGSAVRWLEALVWPEELTVSSACVRRSRSPDAIHPAWCAATFSSCFPTSPPRLRPVRGWWSSTLPCSIT